MSNTQEFDPEGREAAYSVWYELRKKLLEMEWKYPEGDQYGSYLTSLEQDQKEWIIDNIGIIIRPYLKRN